MNATAAKAEEDEPPIPSELGGEWHQFIPDQPKLSLSAEALKRRRDAQQMGSAEVIDFKRAADAAISSHASRNDDSQALARWLRHAELHGYTSPIRTRPYGKRTDRDYVAMFGELYEAPERLKRVAVEVRDDSSPFGARRVFRNVSDAVHVEEIQYEGILTSRLGKERRVTRTKKVYHGLIPLGKPDHVLCTFIPLRFDSRKHFEEDKRVYLERKEYSNRMRKRLGKESWPPESKAILRRPPSVLWFVQHPAGHGGLLDDEPWPHGIVDPRAEGVNRHMRHRLIDAVNSMRADGQVPMQSVRPLKDPYDPDAKRGGCGRYEGEVFDHKAALKAYQEHLKERELVGYSSDGAASNDEELVSDFEGVVYEDDLPFGPKEDNSLELGDVDYVAPRREPRTTPQIGTQLKYIGVEPEVEIVDDDDADGYSAFMSYSDCIQGDDVIEGDYTVVTDEGEEMPEDERVNGMTRRNLARLINKSMDRQLGFDSTALVPVSEPVTDESPLHAVLELFGKRCRFRLGDERDLRYAERLVGELGEKLDALSNIILAMRSVQGWPESNYDVNMDGLLDDAEASVAVEKVAPETVSTKVVYLGQHYRGSFARFEAKAKCYEHRAAVVRARNRTPYRHLAKVARYQRLRALRKKEIRQEREERILELRARRQARLRALEYKRIQRQRQEQKDLRGYYWRLLKVVHPQNYAEYLKRQSSPLGWYRKQFSAITSSVATYVRRGQIARNIQAAYRCREYPVKSLPVGKSNRSVRRSSSKPAVDPIVEAIEYTPIEEVGGQLVRMRNHLRSAGVQPEDLEATEMEIYRWYPSVWSRFLRHKQEREDRREAA